MRARRPSVSNAPPTSTTAIVAKPDSSDAWRMTAGWIRWFSACWYTRVSAKKIPTTLTTVGTETTTSTVRGGSELLSSRRPEIARLFTMNRRHLAHTGAGIGLGWGACRSAWRWGKTA